MRVSVTDLDSWRFYKASDDMDVEALLRRLRREEPPTQAMLAGRALHSALEHSRECAVESLESEGFTFRFIGDFDIPLLAVRELKGDVMIDTPCGPVTLVGVIDGHDGAIHDWKLTERFDAERYADSYQWRCYLTMFNAHKFVYGVFEGKEGDHPNEWTIWGYQSFPLYAYDGMRDDVVREVSELAEFIARHVPEKAAA